MLPAKRCAVREGQESPGVYDATLPTGRARQGGIFLPRVARNFSARRVPLVDRVNWATREASGQYSVRNGQTFGWGATMGSMSASDAAPLPRLGEVFFDVRGSSRSMRLSWYANTGIAVFSIWQGGTCTGTFRLPLDELSRMVNALSQGLDDGLLQATGGQGATGPIALGGQRARLAIGAAPVEAFTGAMSALSDQQAAAYGVARPAQPPAAQTYQGQQDTVVQYVTGPQQEQYGPGGQYA